MNGINFDPHGPLMTNPVYMNEVGGGGSGFADPMTLALLGASAGFLDPQGGMMAGFQGAMHGLNAGNQMKAQAAQGQMTARKLQKQIEIENYMKSLSEKHGNNLQGLLQEGMTSGIPEVMEIMYKTASGLKGQFLRSQSPSGEGVYQYANNIGQVTPTGIPLPPEKLMQINRGSQIDLANPFTGEAKKSIGVGMAPGEAARLSQQERQFGMSHGLAQQNSAIERYKAMQPKFVDGAFVYPPNAENPQGGMIKTDLFSAPKGSDAEKTKMSDRVRNTLGDDTEKLIRESTGSMIGSGVDTVASVFGGTTKGAEANATLKLRAATLAGNMPRFEGPQSDADRKYYLEMAGDLANQSKTTTEKLMALKELKRIHNIAEQNGGIVKNGGASQGGQGSYQGFSSRELP